MNQKVCVVGLGYIGLPTAALLASRGHQVLGVDISQHAVDTINSGCIHIVEPDLDGYVHAAVGRGLLNAQTEPGHADVFMICVPTPFHAGGEIPQPNLDYVMAAARSIAPFVQAGNLIILESTSPVGTTKVMAQELALSGVDIDNVHVAYCPERVLPGRIMIELLENDRVVGGLTPQASTAVAEFYRTFVRGDVLETDAATAEMCKLTENSFRDVNIAFANELSLICERERVDVWRLIDLANRHPRVNILQPGTGVGGHCIAVDPWFIVARDPTNAQLIRTARVVNDNKTHWVIEKVKFAADSWKSERNSPPRLICLGLAFKPDIDDLRESPALDVALALQAQGYDVATVEPNIDSHHMLPVISLSEALLEDGLFVLLVKHKQFLDEKVVAKLRGLSALDFCGALV